MIYLVDYESSPHARAVVEKPEKAARYLARGYMQVELDRFIDEWRTRDMATYAVLKREARAQWHAARVARAGPVVAVPPVAVPTGFTVHYTQQ